MPLAAMTPGGMKRAATLFNNAEYERILKYAKKKGLSVYMLVKKSVREFVEKHP